MTINTKFSIGDIIYSMKDNAVVCEPITSILTDTQIDHKGNIKTEVSYRVNYARVLKQDMVFSSKEELLKTL